MNNPSIEIPLTQASTVRRVGLVLTYNQKSTCIEAIQSLLLQNLPLHVIIVSDDCSTDGTYEVIKDYAAQNNKVTKIETHQSQNNLGFIKHFNLVLSKYCTNSDLIFYNAGDDISEINRVEEFHNACLSKKNPRYFLGHSYVTSFGSEDERTLVPPIEAIKQNRELYLIASAYHIGASQVFTGALFFDFGPILFDDCYEDLTLGYRALLKDAYHFVPKALLRYRVGGLSSWQKNPLEKKRGRLQSTLTQRAVDSIRGGDFNALGIIQDCYSQYGFSLAPHHERLKITVVSEKASNNSLVGYSIANYFDVISNVCETEWKTPANVLDDINGQNILGACLPNVVWVISSRVRPTELSRLLNKLIPIKKVRTVLDLGLTSFTNPISHQESDQNIEKIVTDEFSNFAVHTSNAYLYGTMTNNPDYPKTTYLPPLHNVDGPDPIAQHARLKRGIVVLIDSSPQCSETLAILEKAYTTNKSRLGELHTLRFKYNEFNDATIAQETIKEEGTVSPGEVNLTDYDYLAIIGGPSSEKIAALYYWWGLGAKNCLPTFVSSELPNISDLTHGETCLFVNSSLESWSCALDLVLSEFNALSAVSSKARAYLYFNFSVQKRTKDVTDMLGYNCGLENFFDKFLPL